MLVNLIFVVMIFKSYNRISKLFWKGRSTLFMIQLCWNLIPIMKLIFCLNILLNHLVEFQQNNWFPILKKSEETPLQKNKILGHMDFVSQNITRGKLIDLLYFNRVLINQKIKFTFIFSIWNNKHHIFKDRMKGH